MGCKGLHCGGCHGGGGPAAVVIALLVIIAVAARKAWPQIVHAAEIAAWTVAGITGAAIVVTGGVLTARVARSYRARRAMRRHFTYPPRGGVRLGDGTIHGTIHGTGAELRALAVQLPRAANAVDPPRAS